ARYADMVITTVGELAAQLAITSARPVIAVPGGSRKPLQGKRVLLAWKNTRETIRAATAALPLMTAEGCQVAIVSVEQGRERRREAARVSAGQFADYLSRHDIQAEVEQVDNHMDNVAKTILGEANKRNADL